MDTEPVKIENNLPVATSWSELQSIRNIDTAPRTIDFGVLWHQLFQDKTLDFPRSSETAWGFNQNEEGDLILDEKSDGLSTRESTQEVSLEKPHVLDIHTEPGYTREKLALEMSKPVGRVTDRNMFGASLPKNYLPDVSRLLKHPQTKASMIIRMERAGGLWAVVLVIKTGSYKQPTESERIGYFGRFGRSESLHYNLSFDSKLKNYGVAVYRGFIPFPPKNDGTNYLRKR